MTGRGSLGIVAVLLGALGAVVMLRKTLTDAMLFYPSRGQAATPAAFGLDYEELWLTAPDEVRTQAWWIPAPAPGPVLLHFHGNACTIADLLPIFAEAHALGYAVLAAEYRGYGDSQGSPNEAGLYADALAAAAAARERSGGHKVVAWGHSLGGAVAIHLASLGRVDALIAESTFTSLADMAERTGLPFARRVVAYEFDSLGKLPRVDLPVLLIHGEDDEVVPFSMGVQLHEAARSNEAVGRKIRFVRVPSAHHGDVAAVAGPKYWETLRIFLAELSV